MAGSSNTVGGILFFGMFGRCRLCGNMMACTSLAIVLAPILQQLGFLTEVL